MDEEKGPGGETQPGPLSETFTVGLRRKPLLLHQMDVAVGSAASTVEVEAAYLGVSVTDPVLTLGTDDDLDGTGAVLDDSIADGVSASLGHDGLPFLVVHVGVCLTIV